MSLKQILIAIDQLGNALAGGWADETLSARLWRCWLQGTTGPAGWQFVDAIFFWESNHCYQSWRSEVDRAQLPGHYRQ